MIRDHRKKKTPVRVLPAKVVPPPTITAVRASIIKLAETADLSVKIVREAFTAGVAPYQTAGSGSAGSYVAQFTKDKLGSKITRSTSHLGLKTSTAGSSVPPPKPELDEAEIIEGPGGVLDQFSIKLTFSISAVHLDQVTAVKVMRARLGPVKTVKPSVSALINAPVTPGANKDRMAASAFRAAEMGVGNKLTSFIVDDPNSLKRAVRAPDAQEFRPPLPPQNTNRGAASGPLLNLQGADRSILENLTFYRNRRTSDAIEKPVIDTITLGNKSGINVLRGNSVSESTEIVQEFNALQFSEVGRFDMSNPGVRAIGDFLESTFVDKAVVYGTAFVYYVSCIGKDGAEGPRSKLVKASVVRTVPPEQPKVTYSIIGGHPRFVISCPRGTDHVEIFRSGMPVDTAVRLGTDQSLIVQGPAVKIGEFWHIGDVGIGPDGSTTFVDTDVLGGAKLSYRVYSVDPYGFKSQTPFSCSLKMPDLGHNVPIPVPSITVEQAPGQPGISVKMQVDDPRVAGFTVQRRDVTIAEKSVHQANQPEYVDIGFATPKRAGSRRGPTLRDADWPVYVPAAGGSASFVDSSVRLDRKYQYAIGAIDRRGNKTLLVGSQPVGVYSKTVIDPPTAFGAKLIVNGSSPAGVMLTWTGGTNDFSPNAIVGDQDVLDATRVRSVFQVERRQVGAPFWDALPATSESYFFDKASAEPAPAFRPAYVIPGAQYEYRVMAMQSGGFISPRSDSKSISIIPPPLTPEIVWVKSTPLSVSPLTIVVSWNMSSEFVERWEIERAVTNKIFGEQITSMDSRLALTLKYEPVAAIPPEASRARGLSTDSKDLDPNIYVGNRFYVDSDVLRSNSYFYRVRTIGRLGIASAWNYSGVVLKDSAFDRKMMSTLSDNKKLTLTRDPRPVRDHRKVVPIRAPIDLGRIRRKI